MATNISGSGDSTFGGTIQSTGIDDNATSTKLTTTSTGINVTGTVTADGLTVDANTLYVDSTNNRVGIGTSSPSVKLQVVGTSNTDVALLGTVGTRLTVEPNDATGEVKLKVEDPSGNNYSKFMTFHTAGGSGASERMRIDSSGNLKFDSGYGSAATAYGCRAWVNFNGTGTIAIRASGNVSSITDNGTGQYTVNFTNAMPDANYVVSGSAGNNGATTDARAINRNGTWTTSLFQIRDVDGSGTVQDDVYIGVAVFR